MSQADTPYAQRAARTRRAESCERRTLSVVSPKEGSEYAKNRPYLLCLGVNAGARVALALSLCAGLVAAVPVRAGGVERADGWRAVAPNAGRPRCRRPPQRRPVRCRRTGAAFPRRSRQCTAHALRGRVPRERQARTVPSAGRRAATRGGGASYVRARHGLRDRAGLPWVLALTAGGHVHALAAVRHVTSLNGIAFDTTGRLQAVCWSWASRAAVAAYSRASTAAGRCALLRAARRTWRAALSWPQTGSAPSRATSSLPMRSRVGCSRSRPTAAFGTSSIPGSRWAVQIAVESLGIVPPARASAFLADRRTPGNADPGHDAILRLSADDLLAAGVAPGDMLATLEGGGRRRSRFAARPRAPCARSPARRQERTPRGQSRSRPDPGVRPATTFSCTPRRLAAASYCPANRPSRSEVPAKRRIAPARQAGGHRFEPSIAHPARRMVEPFRL